MFQAIQGHWLSACLGVLMDLKIPEILHAQEKPIEFAQVPIVNRLVCVMSISTGGQYVNMWLVSVSAARQAGRRHHSRT